MKVLTPKCVLTQPDRNDLPFEMIALHSCQANIVRTNAKRGADIFRGQYLERKKDRIRDRERNRPLRWQRAHASVILRSIRSDRAYGAFAAGHWSSCMF
jgi:hypothetical protein